MTLLALVATVASSIAAPPDAPKAIVAQPGQMIRIVIKNPVDKDGKVNGAIGHLTTFDDQDAFWGELVSPTDLERHFVYQAPLLPPPTSKVNGVKGSDGGVTITHGIGFFTVGEKSGKGTSITVTYPPTVPVVPPVVPPTPAPTPTPTPAPPAPPTPAPPPTPVAPPPIPVAGLHVLVVYDPIKINALTEAAKGAMFSQDVRDYLNKTCPLGPDGTKAEWRMWPNNADTSQESALWQAAYKRPRTGDFWVIVSNGTTGFEGPLPASKDDMLALLKKYGDK